MSGSSARAVSRRNYRKRSKKKQEGTELKEQFKVCCNLHLFRLRITIIPPQKREEAERGEGEAAVSVIQEPPKPTGSDTESPAQTEITTVPPAATQGPSSDNRSDEYEGVPPVASSTSSSWIDVDSHSMPQGHLSQNGQSGVPVSPVHLGHRVTERVGTDLQDGKGAGSYFEPSNRSDGGLSRQVDTPGGAGCSTKNLQVGGKSCHQSLISPNEAPAENQGPPLHGIHQDQHEHREESEEHSGAPNPPIKGVFPPCTRDRPRDTESPLFL